MKGVKGETWQNWREPIRVSWNEELPTTIKEGTSYSLNSTRAVEQAYSPTAGNIKPKCLTFYLLLLYPKQHTSGEQDLSILPEASTILSHIHPSPPIFSFVKTFQRLTNFSSNCRKLLNTHHTPISLPLQQTLLESIPLVLKPLFLIGIHSPLFVYAKFMIVLLPCHKPLMPS